MLGRGIGTGNVQLSVRQGVKGLSDKKAAVATREPCVQGKLAATSRSDDEEQVGAERGEEVSGQ